MVLTTQKMTTRTTFIIIIIVFCYNLPTFAISSTEIANLQGTWIVTGCKEGPGCILYYNYTMEFIVDTSNNSITSNISFLDSIKNEYVKYTAKYTYS